MHTLEEFSSGVPNGLRPLLVVCHVTRVIACFHRPGCQRETKYLIHVAGYKSLKAPLRIYPKVATCLATNGGCAAPYVNTSNLTVAGRR